MPSPDSFQRCDLLPGRPAPGTAEAPAQTRRQTGGIPKFGYSFVSRAPGPPEASALSSLPGARRPDRNGPPPNRRTSRMSGFHYVYLLDSLTRPSRRYFGVTQEFSARLREHNLGAVPETVRDRPWKIRAVVAFRDPGRAEAFGNYLKTSAGRTFARRWL